MPVSSPFACVSKCMYPTRLGVFRFCILSSVTLVSSYRPRDCPPLERTRRLPACFHPDRVYIRQLYILLDNLVSADDFQFGSWSDRESSPERVPIREASVSAVRSRERATPSSSADLDCVWDNSACVYKMCGSAARCARGGRRERCVSRRRIISVNIRNVGTARC
jgi:hypothetical protein